LSESAAQAGGALLSATGSRVKRWRVGAVATAFGVAMLLLVLQGASPAYADPPTQSLSILGGNGAAGTVDPTTDWSQDPVVWNSGISTTGAWHFTGNANPTWHPAYRVGSHPWGFVPGTNGWINCGPTNASS